MTPVLVRLLQALLETRLYCMGRREMTRGNTVTQRTMLVLRLLAHIGNVCVCGEAGLSGGVCVCVGGGGMHTTLWSTSLIIGVFPALLHIFAGTWFDLETTSSPDAPDVVHCEWLVPRRCGAPSMTTSHQRHTEQIQCSALDIPPPSGLSSPSPLSPHPLPQGAGHPAPS